MNRFDGMNLFKRFFSSNPVPLPPAPEPVNVQADAFAAKQFVESKHWPILVRVCQAQAINRIIETADPYAALKAINAAAAIAQLPSRFIVMAEQYIDPEKQEAEEKETQEAPRRMITRQAPNPT